jgi:hypothetical protein
MKYASQDYMDNMFGRYNPARQIVKNKNRQAQEELEAKLEKESKGDCGCGGNNG